VIGGCGFIVSSAIIMLEVQHEWYLPNVLDIGWQGASISFPSNSSPMPMLKSISVGFWNLLGAFGFMLCGAFGYSTKSGLVYESGLSTFWGSWAFLIGGFFQTWETLWREPPSPPQGSSKSSV